MAILAGLACLNLPLIPRNTYIGSAVAMVVSEGALLFLLYAQVVPKVVPIPVLLHFWKPALACIPMIVFLDRCGIWSLLGRIPAGGVIYFLSLSAYSD
jgi:hypothetical protein